MLSLDEQNRSQNKITNGNVRGVTTGGVCVWGGGGVRPPTKFLNTGKIWANFNDMVKWDWSEIKKKSMALF